MLTHDPMDGNAARTRPFSDRRAVEGPRAGFREIPLESGAHGVLLTLCMDRATRRSADGRWPVDNGTHAFDAAVC